MNTYSRQLKKFILRTILASLMLLPIPLIYLVADPFRVLPGSYPYKTNNSNISFNRGYLSTLAYLEGRKKDRYDSFILGNSQCQMIDICKFEDSLTTPGKALQFDASLETIEGVCRKIRLIKNNGDTIRNMVIGLYAYLDGVPEESIPFRLPWQTTDESMLGFQWYYFTQFLRYELFLETVEFLIYDRQTSDIGIVFSFCNDSVDIRHNIFFSSEAEKYYDKNSGRGLSPVYDPDRFTEVGSPITAAQVEMLREIKVNLEGTNHLFVIYPRGDMKCPSKENLQTLREIFGDSHVLDLSRFPDAYTGEMTFYDSVHFTRKVGRIITDSIINVMKRPL